MHGVVYNTLESFYLRSFSYALQLCDVVRWRRGKRMIPQHTDTHTTLARSGPRAAAAAAAAVATSAAQLRPGAAVAAADADGNRRSLLRLLALLVLVLPPWVLLLVLPPLVLPPLVLPLGCCSWLAAPLLPRFQTIAGL